MRKRGSAPNKLSIYILVGCSFLIIWKLIYFHNDISLVNIQNSNNAILSEIKYPEEEFIDSLSTLQDGSPTNSSEILDDQVQVCKLPKVDPFERRVYKAFLRSVWSIKRANCSSKHKPVFRSSIYSNEIYVDEVAFQELNLTDCFYRHFVRSDKTEHKVLVSQKTFKIVKPITRIPPSHEFIAIECTYNHNPYRPRYRDMHVFVRLKNVPFNNVPLLQYQGHKRPNVVILLVDSVSRMSFIRAMPKSYALLKTDLDAIDLSGFMKVGDNTLPNVLAMLTGKSWAETESVTGCVPTNSTPFDDCPFIWKDFKKQGYITSLAEDAEIISTFSYYQRRGFAHQPTDTYFRPLFYAMIVASLTSDGSQCAGSKHRISLLLEYMQKVAVASFLRKNLPYFQFVLSASTHSSNGHAASQDKYIKSFLNWYKQNGFLENSVFILMSDHGARWGRVQKTPQGYIESRMPFAFLLCPPWFKESYPLAMKNLMKNQNRLTTPFDLHETLNDILRLDDNLEDTKVIERTEKLHHLPLISMPRGISLFLPIPLKRTCSMAGISGLYCVCNLDESIELDVDSKIVVSAAKEAVRFINRKLSSVMDLCAEAKLHQVKSARLRKDSEVDEQNLQTVDLKIVTQPGKAVYEATMAGIIDPYNETLDENGVSDWKVVDGLTRTNTYEYSSRCLNSKATKMYCICKNNNNPD